MRADSRDCSHRGPDTGARARAQGNTGSVGGAVRDEQKLSVPGATVTIAATDSVLTRTVTAGPDGGFEFPGLLPGEYVLTTELSGFQREQTRVRLEVNQRVRVDIVLRAAGLAQQVEVRETIALLHTTDGAVGEVIDQQQVAELPLNGRQFLELALLVPGAHRSHGAQMGDMSPLYWRPGQNSAITIAGARPNSNVYLLDGTVNTDPSFNTYVISLPPDAIREFQIQTGTYTAELGAGTGQINVVSRSGTFKVKGSLYEYVRNSRFDSPEFTNPDELPPFSQNQFGATLGGPAGHRVFFFGGYEGLRTTQHMSGIMFVPGTAVRLGDFSGGKPIYDPLTNRANPAFNPALPITAANPQFIRTQFPDNKIPLDRINPIARQVLQKYVVQPNRDDPTDNYLDTRAQTFQNDAFNVRARSVLGERHVPVRPLQPEQRDRLHAREPAGLRRLSRQSRPEPERDARQPHIEASGDRDALRLRSHASAPVRRNGEWHGPRERARD